MVSAAALVELMGAWADGADPLNEQLADALARSIEMGLLPPGTRLPAERELARELALSRTTIVAAYDRLRLAGLARSRQGSGTRVATRRPGLFPPLPTPAEDTDTERPVRIGRAAVEPASIGLLGTSDPADAIQLTLVRCRPAPPSPNASRPPCARTFPPCCTSSATTRSGCLACAWRSPTTSDGSASRRTPTRSS